MYMSAGGGISLPFTAIRAESLSSPRLTAQRRFSSPSSCRRAKAWCTPGAGDIKVNPEDALGQGQSLKQADITTFQTFMLYSFLLKPGKTSLPHQSTLTFCPRLSTARQLTVQMMQNPQILAALQERLDGLNGSPSGYMERAFFFFFLVTPRNCHQLLNVAQHLVSSSLLECLSQHSFSPGWPHLDQRCLSPN
ncbi:hypothetical protein XENOCAPTIV_013036 [Xenoophorus captivus]|uniref:Uncharacterized protein n=1 Tax=Xenoophorus captivus TaxID=1517983 RepID=A0ABV0Q3Q1_9TELE